MQAAFVLPVVFLAFAIQSGESIKCYNCNSASDPKCADPFMTGENSNLLVECTPDFVKQASDAINAVSKKVSEFASSLDLVKINHLLK
uniref:Secreted Mys2-like protein n=1 Tax=Pristhesancus plagipennis TaxID=1955184 RepID=A0A2K8JMA1_PRIPG|nr:secreted Mys2-like protein [Pristhesancus plagipennis]